MIKNRHMITTAEAARRLGISVPTLNKWARTGKITPAIKAPGLRGARMYDEEHIASLAVQRCTCHHGGAQ